jgi:acyl-[acyl-carrier-protein]-phospholipid O-acyltransferase/long-chain-fatty-acid--[acyl-carrier-protein] ligase
MVSAPGSDKKSHESDQRSAGDRQRLGLLSVSFTGLLGLQFLTVLNDNTYRWLVVPIGYAVLGQQYRSLILTLGIVCFTVPYILLPAPAGYLADRFSKRTVMAGTMLLQAVILVFGVGSILITNALLVFITLGLMGAQGALLAPSKLGVIPEIVREERISAANGLMGMASVLAAVVGTVLGNELYVLTAPKGTTHWWFSGGTVIGIALLGWAVSLLVAREPASSAPPWAARTCGSWRRCRR